MALTRSFQRSLGTRLGCVTALLLAFAPAHAGPLDELKSLAQLPPIDLAKLKSGEIVTNRRPLGDFSRGISVESCYFIHAPVETVAQRLLHWNPTAHRDLAVRLYGDYRWPAPGEAFKSLRLTSRVADDHWLIEQTLAIADGGSAGELHLTAADIDLIRRLIPKKDGASAQIREAKVSEAWQEILRGRSESFERGGFATVAPYGSDNSISPASELRGLLSLAPGAAKHFRSITDAKPISSAGSAAADEAVGYWEATKVRNHTTVQLGLFAARKSGDACQLIDCVYYPSDTYFMALDLFQLWPMESGTLIWQVGFVSAPFRSYLGGVDRFVAGKQMTQETLDTINAFRRDIEKRR